MSRWRAACQMPPARGSRLCGAGKTLLEVRSWPLLPAPHKALRPAIAAPVPPAQPPRHLYRTDVASVLMSNGGASTARRAVGRVGRPQTAPPARSAVCAPYLARWQARKANSFRPRSAAPKPPWPPQGSVRHRYRPTKDVSAPPDWPAAKTAARLRPDASPPRKPPDHCLKRTAQPDPPASAPSLGAGRFDPVRGFRERRHAWWLSPLAPRGSRLRSRGHVPQSQPAGCGAACPPKGGRTGCVHVRPRPAPTDASVCPAQRYSL